MHDNPTNALPPALEIETTPSPTHTVIWLHGLGADGHDFEPMVEALDTTRLPPLRFVFPHAPLRAITVNNGYVMRAWYDIDSLDFDGRNEDAVGILGSARQLEALIARENSRGIADRNIVLAGFSQGGAIALETALRHSHRLAGLLAVSTYLPRADTVAREAHLANRNLPIFMAHGTEDPVVPLKVGERSVALLRELGYPLEWRTYPVEHTITMPELHDIEAWLEQILA